MNQRLTVFRQLINTCTVKALINARAFIKIITFHREGLGVNKRLECSQSIFENQNILFVLSRQYHVKLLYELLFPVENCKINLFITYLADEKKKKHVLLAIEQ